MVKRCLLLISFLPLLLAAQYPKYMVQLTDKHHSAYNLSHPEQYLSSRAIERRKRFNIPIDSSDLPVNQWYIDSLLSKGNIRLLSSSRWLNRVLVYTTDSVAIKHIQSLAFVQKIAAVGFRNIGSSKAHFTETTRELPEQMVQKQADNNVYDYGNAYAQVHIHNGEFLHNKGFDGRNITIALLDGGFNRYTEVKALDSTLKAVQFLGVRDFVDFDNSVTEDDPHGTYCLSTIAANEPGKMTGTAPKANFWLIRTEQTASEYPVEEFNWAVGAEFADSVGADMISSSLGYNEFDDAAFNHSYADFYTNAATVSKAAAIAAAKGLIITNSAGNEGNNSWHYLIFPADADSVCAVGAVDVNGQIAGFSSRGYPGKIKPNVVSVGAGTTVAGADGIFSGNGTSFSNPNLAGLIACLWQAFPAVSSQQILQAVYQSANKYTQPDNAYGYGIPDMKAAYRLLKKQQNDNLYGSEWLKASPLIFTDTLQVWLRGRVDGKVVISLLSSTGKIFATQTITTETEEITTLLFNHLQPLPAGDYIVHYADSTIQRSITVTKNGDNTNWLQALPNPFQQQLTVYLKAPSSGNAAIRLIDNNGKIIETQKVNLIVNTPYSCSFLSAAALPHGIYFIEYRDAQQHLTIKLVK